MSESKSKKATSKGVASDSKPKKSAPKKAEKKADSKSPVSEVDALELKPEPEPEPELGPEPEPEPEPEPRIDGVELARLRRLRRAGIEVDRCDLLGIRLDVGPRANPWFNPKIIDGSVISQIGFSIIASGVSSSDLRFAADQLSKGEKS